MTRRLRVPNGIDPLRHQSGRFLWFERLEGRHLLSGDSLAAEDSLTESAVTSAATVPASELAPEIAAATVSDASVELATAIAQADPGALTPVIVAAGQLLGAEEVVAEELAPHGPAPDAPSDEPPAIEPPPSAPEPEDVLPPAPSDDGPEGEPPDEQADPATDQPQENKPENAIDRLSARNPSGEKPSEQDAEGEPPTNHTPPLPPPPPPSRVIPGRATGITYPTVVRYALQLIAAESALRAPSAVREGPLTADYQSTATTASRSARGDLLSNVDELVPSSRPTGAIAASESVAQEQVDSVTDRDPGSFATIALDTIFDELGRQPLVPAMPAKGPAPRAAASCSTSRPGPARPTESMNAKEVANDSNPDSDGPSVAFAALEQALVELLDDMDDFAQQLSNTLWTTEYSPWWGTLAMAAAAGGAMSKRYRTRRQAGSRAAHDTVCAVFPELMYLVDA